MNPMKTEHFGVYFFPTLRLYRGDQIVRKSYRVIRQGDWYRAECGSVHKAPTYKETYNVSFIGKPQLSVAMAMEIAAKAYYETQRETPDLTEVESCATFGSVYPVLEQRDHAEYALHRGDSKLLLEYREANPRRIPLTPAVLVSGENVPQKVPLGYDTSRKNVPPVIAGQPSPTKGVGEAVRINGELYLRAERDSSQETASPIAHTFCGENSLGECLIACLQSCINRGTNRGTNILLEKKEGRREESPIEEGIEKGVGKGVESRGENGERDSHNPQQKPARQKFPMVHLRLCMEANQHVLRPLNSLREPNTELLHTGSYCHVIDTVSGLQKLVPICDTVPWNVT